MFLSKNKAIGINISDQNIKISKLTKDEKGSVVASFKKIKIDEGLIERGKIKDEDKLLKYFKGAIQNMGIKNFSLYDFYVVFPEASLYTYFFKTEALNEKDLTQKIEKEALSSIPLNKEELVYSYKILDKNINKKTNATEYRIFIAAASSEIINTWKEFFDKLKIKIVDFSVEAVTSFYGLFKKYPEEPVCIIDIGSNITNIVIGFKNNLFYSYSYFCGGNTCTKKIAQGLKSDEKEFDLNEAEKIKREVGLLGSDKYNNISVILKSSMLPVIDEIVTALNYFKEEKKENITKIYLIGGSSRTKGIKEYIASNLPLIEAAKEEGKKEGTHLPKKVEVLSGEDFLGVDIPVDFASSYGAALQAFDKEKRKDSILLPTEFSPVVKAEEDEEPDDLDDEEEEYVGKFSWIKNNPRKFQLILIFIFGILLMSLAFWIRSQDAKKKLANRPQSEMAPFSVKKKIEMKVQAAIDSKDYSSEKIRARIFKSEIKKPMNYDEVLLLANEEVEKQLAKGEIYWKDPLNEVNKNSLIFPLSLEWFVYMEKDINQVFLLNLKKQESEEFLLNLITVREIINEGDDYFVVADVDIAVDEVSNETEQDIVVPNSEKSEIKVNEKSNNLTPKKEEIVEVKNDVPKSLQELSALLSKKEKVRVIETGTGYLNIRTQPTTSSNILYRIKTGEDCEILEEKDTWIKIFCTNGEEGWGFGEYLEKIEN